MPAGEPRVAVVVAEVHVALGDEAALSPLVVGRPTAIFGCITPFSDWVMPRCTNLVASTLLRATLGAASSGMMQPVAVKLIRQSNVAAREFWWLKRGSERAGIHECPGAPALFQRCAMLVRVAARYVKT